MKSFGVLLLGAISMSLLSGCFINSAQPTSTAVTGEAWYTKSRIFSSSIYFCDGKSNVCKEAEIR